MVQCGEPTLLKVYQKKSNFYPTHSFKISSKKTWIHSEKSKLFARINDILLVGLQQIFFRSGSHQDQWYSEILRSFVRINITERVSNFKKFRKTIGEFEEMLFYFYLHLNKYFNECFRETNKQQCCITTVGNATRYKYRERQPTKFLASYTRAKRKIKIKTTTHRRRELLRAPYKP